MLGVDPMTAVGLAVFFELLWLDLFPAGTYIPPHLPAATCAAFGIVAAFDLSSPEAVAPVLLLCMPLGPLGAKLESRLRALNDRHFDSLARASNSISARFVPVRVLWRSLAVTLSIMLAAFCVALGILFAVIPDVLLLWNGLSLGRGIGWPLLWLAGSVGGILALRWKRAYGLLAAAAVLLALNGAFVSVAL